MNNSMWGQKIGMTQIFSMNSGRDNAVSAVPVTVIDCNGWIVVRMKKFESDGYNALQIGLLRTRYRKESFVDLWLKNPKRYFLHLKEVYVNDPSRYTVGASFGIEGLFQVGQKLDVAGWSKGLGFAGVYKRHGFGGAAKSHGSMMGRRPGSIGFTRSSGEIMKGQKMAGHKGVERKTIQNLELVSIENDKNILLVKGSVPGKSQTLLFIKKSIKE